jgi:hypothetical protein
LTNDIMATWEDFLLSFEQRWVMVAARDGGLSSSRLSDSDQLL